MNFIRTTALAALVSCSTVQAEDWLRFRGPAGSGVVESAESIPTQWSPSTNLAWTSPLPGPGVSSPIVVGDKVFVTCYSGYGLDQADPGDMENLMRHLVCVDLQTGEKIWQRDVKANLPEDPYSGIGVTAHGYASHTPVSDGKHVYAFFGKSGVHAFDLDGNPVWQAAVGKESDPRRWGSSSSPILYKDTVIVTAAAESQAIVGFDASSGKELWRQEAEGLDNMWGTPTLVQVDDNRTDLVMCVAKELWGLDPESGKLRWYAEATDADQASASAIIDGKRVFAFTGRGGGSVAIDVGQGDLSKRGDISDFNTLWEGSDTTGFGTPVKHGSNIYLVTSGVVTVVDAETGEKVDQVRLAGAKRSGGRFGSLDYPSPIVIGDRLFYLNGSGQMFVFELGDDIKQIAVNEVTTEAESFGGTPAVSNGRLILRGSKNLYCVTDKSETVAPADAEIAKSEVETEGNSRPERGAGGGRGPGNRGPGGPGGDAGGNRRFDPMSIFTQRDGNKDGKLTAEELAGSPLADRVEQLDKDGDKAVSQEEFRAGMATMFGGGGRGGSRGGPGGRGGGPRGGPEDSRPDRPQRPEMAG